MPATATTPRATPAPKPKVSEKRRFTAPNGGRIIAILRRFRGGFLVFTQWKEPDEPMKKGAYSAYTTEAEARAGFAEKCQQLLSDGWTEKLAVPVGDFTELPKPGAPAPRPVATPKPPRARRTG